MRSFKNHLSLIMALFTILFAIQIFINVQRAVSAYETTLSDNYSIIVISNSALTATQLTNAHSMIKSSETVSVDEVLNKLTHDMKQKNVDLLKISLPKFYRIRLDRYPSPEQIASVSSALKRIKSITKVESFSQSHDRLFGLLVLVKYVVVVLAVSTLIVTTLLIIKEMRIWQFQHMERMNIMALFGAPVWLRSAVLFRLAIVDAVIASILVSGTFFALNMQPIIHDRLQQVNISITLFEPIQDAILLSSIALSVSILLASMIIMGHKEEV